MKAMVLAAGLGTRLRPLTDNRPKALVEVGGRALLEITLSRLRTFGISEVIVNVHHFADMVIDYLKSKENLGLRIEVSREDVLLDTGGGLKKAAWFFLEDPSRLDEPFLLHNVDVISTIDFHRMLQFHTENHALATLAVQSRQSSRLLLFNNQLQLRGRRAGGTANPGCATQITATQKQFVSKDENPQIAPDSASSRADLPVRNILAFRADDYYWRDLGRPADLAEAAHDLKQRALRQ